MHRPMPSAADRHLVWRGSLAAKRNASPTRRGKFACRHSDMSTAFPSPSVELLQCLVIPEHFVHSDVVEEPRRVARSWDQQWLAWRMLGKCLVSKTRLCRGATAGSAQIFALPRCNSTILCASTNTLTLRDKRAGASGLRMQILDSKIKD